MEVSPLSFSFSSAAKSRVLISRVPFFKGLREDVIVDVCQQINQFAIMPGDDIMHRGDPYRDLIIVTKGTARTVPKEEGGISSRSSATGLSSQSGLHLSGVDVCVEYDRGTFFGELEFLGISTERSTTVQAKVYCEVATIHPKDIQSVIEDDPELHLRLHRYVELKQRIEQMAKDGNEVDELEVERIKEEIESAFVTVDANDDINPRSGKEQALDDDPYEEDMKVLFGDIQKDQEASNTAILGALANLQSTLAEQGKRLDSIEAKMS